MSTTNFTDKSTVIQADWLNEVDALVHDIFGAATTKTQARTNLAVTVDIDQIQAVVKQSDETVNNSDTLQDDDELVVSVAADESLLIEYRLFVESGATPDFKFTITAPSGATGLFSKEDTSYVSIGTSESESISGGTEAVWVCASISNGSTAGNVTLQWAQNTADASDTTVKALSSMIVHRIP